MQKKLIALAVAGLASGAAFAQSNLTISGNIDLGYTSTAFGTTTLMDAKTAALGNGSSTSALNFIGKEDIGGGTTVGFLLSNEFTPGASTSAFINAQSYLEIAGSFGSVKLGTINTQSHNIMGTVAQPLSTSIGSGHTSAFGRFSRSGLGATGAGLTPVTAVAEGETATGTSGARLQRVSSAVRYDTPSFNGFKGSLLYSAKNSDATAGIVATAQTPSGVELGVTYNNGPLNVAYANYQLSQGSVTNVLTASEKMTHNAIAANYNFGAATVYGGWSSSKQSGLAAVGFDSRSWNLALKYAVSSSLSLLANVVKVDVKTAGNQDRSLTGLGLDYALSKRSTAYARYETGDNDKANTGAVDGKFTRWAVGLRHSF